MSLNNIATADRIHIAFFGKRNVGKSSLVNAITGQQLSVVSKLAGTTTDPVHKSMELLPLGPVVIIDTAGFDDVGTLGGLRVEKTKQMLAKTDIAVFVVDNNVLDDKEKAFLKLIQDKNVPYILVRNKSDLMVRIPTAKENEVFASATNNTGIQEIKDMLGAFAKKLVNNKKIVSDLLNKGDVVALVTPIDNSAPKGRLILPQQQTIRDVIDAGCIAIVCQVGELAQTLEGLKKPPKMVITDSQAFEAVDKIVPTNIPLTSFSILFARYKGGLDVQVKGASTLSKLVDGDNVLIAEGCTHHRQCGDIGTDKMPKWIQNFSGAKLNFTFTSGGEFPQDLAKYKLVVHCGGCMLNDNEMKHRLATAKANNVPVVNYGMAIAHVHGILPRALELFPQTKKLLD